MRVGVITFHGSHNCGSMLQAYALQELVEGTGNSCEIINFRMQSQKDYYALYPTKYGYRRLLRSLSLLPLHAARTRRVEKFERFLSTRYHLSGRELQTYEDLEEIADVYDVYMSGSDQIWHADVPEIRFSPVDYSGVYFLDFVSPGKRKIAFATSAGEMTYERLLEKKPLLEQYECISMREESGSQILERMLGCEVPVVLDPTLLLEPSKWRQIEGDRPLVEGRYIFLYSLQGMRRAREWAWLLERAEARFGMKAVCISPFFPVPSQKVTNVVDAGPEEFLNLMDHAELVLTDTFHGTAFSVNFGKPFYSLTPPESHDERKRSLLKLVGLEDRMIQSVGDLEDLSDYELDASVSQAVLAQERVRCKRVLEQELR